MSWEIVFTLAVLAAAVALFASERLRVDVVALLVLAVLAVSGVVSPQDAFRGFSNAATVTVAAMFVLSAGLLRTGALDRVGTLLAALARHSLPLAAAALMLVIGPISAFINNTAAVAIFLPVVLATAREAEVSASKLLIPLSFASMFGGVCTLLGTSTNILVSAIAADHGQEPFGMFEFAPLGLAMYGIGFVYMLVVGLRLLPERRPTGEDLTATFGMGDYLTDLVLLPDADAVGHTLEESRVVAGLDVDVLKIERDGRSLHLPQPGTVLRAGDVLRVRCDAERIRELAERAGVELQEREHSRWSDEDLESSDVVLVEAVVMPNSRLDGDTLARTRFRNVFGATVLALRHHQDLRHQDLSRVRLAAGDTLLIELPRARLAQLRRQPDLALVSEHDVRKLREDRLLLALGVIAGVVVAASTGLLAVPVAAAAGAVLLVVGRVLTIEEAYEAVDWKVIFLLAGVLTLGTAMEGTGTAALLSRGVVWVGGALGPVAVVAAFYLLTSLLTETMSNNATAAVLAPVAIAAAATLGVDPRPLLMAVTFAASASFMTPMGYQTNLLVYGPGRYRFSDFLRVGAPLNLLFWLLATLMIPRIWPL